MNKVNFELIYKVIVLVLLTLILTSILKREEPTIPQTNNYHSQIGRYKEIKHGTEVLILDTETGETSYP